MHFSLNALISRLFYTFSSYFLDSRTIVSTWLDCSILMSAYRPVTPYYRKTAPFVIGNLSRAFSVHENLSTIHFDSSREQVENCSLSYNMRFHISAHRLNLDSDFIATATMLTFCYNEQGNTGQCSSDAKHSVSYICVSLASAVIT